MKSAKRIALLPALALALLLGPGAAGAGAADFGIAAFDGSITDAAGAPLAQAGAHPATFTTIFDYNTAFFPELGALGPVEDAHHAIVELPPGYLGGTAGLPRCSASQLAHGAGATEPKPDCPERSQIGLLHIRTTIGPEVVETTAPPVFNMAPPPGSPARFGINVAGALIVLDTDPVPRGGDYVLRTTAEVPQGLAIVGNTLTLWAVPWASSHDSERSCSGELNALTGGPSCNVDGEKFDPNAPPLPPPAEVIPTFRTPTACSDRGMRFDLAADSWPRPGVFAHASYRTHQDPGYPQAPADWGTEVGTTGCAALPFTPSIATALSTERADSPTGIAVELTMPQDCWAPKATVAEVEAAICQSDMKEASVTLPPGLSINPAAADGQASCSPAQAGLTSAPGATPVQFDRSPVTCPDASKLGSVEITTPLLDDPIPGTVYLAEQGENPFGSLLALYLVIEGQGVRIKQAGEISLGPEGRVTTTFAQIPQQPFSKIHLELSGGPRAALRTPAACGTYTTDASLTPWSGNAAVDASSGFRIGEACGGGFDPKLSAGTRNPLAGSYSPFSLRVTREDGMQEIAGLEETLPKGLIGALKGIPYCPEAVLASFPAETVLGTGAAQEAAPSCPPASQLGTVTVGAGAGPTPFYTASGRAYLAGPYKGAPLSIAVLAPAVAGPFDLGTVAVRNAVHIDPESARVSVASDPLPRVVHGIPLDLRDVRVNLDRPDFILNPTSCEPAQITSLITSAQGAKASPSAYFQAAGCDRLGFRPKLSLRLKGGTRRSRHPALTAVLTAPRGGAGIAGVQVALPHSEFLAQNHIRTICTRVQFAAGGGGGTQCPKGSVYGRVAARSPLVDYPLAGKVYLRSSEHPLPDMVLALHGPPGQPIRIDAVGRIDTKDGGIRTTFAALPDAPLDKVVLRLPGGRKSLLENSTDLCRSAHRATVRMEGHNGKRAAFRPPLKVSCAKPGGAGGHGGR